MKIFVYNYPTESGGEGNVSCKIHEQVEDLHLFSIIEAEETDLPINEVWVGDGIEIGEVFSCNDVVPNLIRAA